MSERPEQQAEDLMVFLHHLYQDIERAFSRHAELSLSRMEVLHELMHAGEISQAELQRRLGMEGSLMTRFAKQMEAAGLITRRADPKDNRFTLVALAPAGWQQLERREALGKDFQARLLKGVSEEEMRCLWSVLRHINENLADMK